SVLESILDGYKVKGALSRRAVNVDVKPDDPSQHEDRGDHGVQEELDGGIDAPLMSIHADHQRHRYQRRFPEDIKEEQIQCDKNADHRRLEYQHQDKKISHATMN